MADARIVELTIPGTLMFRDLALRVVMESCRLVTQVVSRRDGGQSKAGRTNSNRSAAAAQHDDSSSDARNQSVPAGISSGQRYDFDHPFTSAFVSAFSEIFNNIAIHAYERSEVGSITLRIAIGPDHLIVDLTDTGKTFDIDAVPLPEKLPTGGMGIHIARSMLDELEYRPGPPNRWRLAKYLSHQQASAESSIASSTTAE